MKFFIIFSIVIIILLIILLYKILTVKKSNRKIYFGFKGYDIYQLKHLHFIFSKNKGRKR